MPLPPQNQDNHARGFASTHWTQVRDCVGNGKSAQAAREILCRDYWYPVYAYIRRMGHQEFDAEDLTQGFFEHILYKPWFEKANREKGKFRSFLLSSLDNYLRDVHSGQRTIRRGAGCQHVPLDLAEARSRYASTPSPLTTPVETYENHWAMTVVDSAWRRLEAEHAGTRASLFSELRAFLTIEGSAASYDAAAFRLGTTASSVKVAVHRLRKRYGALLREEVARTLIDPRDSVEEMAHIRNAFAERAIAAA